MKKLLLICIPIVICCVGCPRTTRLDQVHATRFVEDSPNSYRWEDGILGKDGFIPATVSRYRYADAVVLDSSSGEQPTDTSAVSRLPSGYSKAEIHKVNGKPVTPLAYWSGIQDFTDFKRSSETVLLDGVPHVMIMR